MHGVVHRRPGDNAKDHIGCFNIAIVGVPPEETDLGTALEPRQKVYLPMVQC